MKKNLVFRTPYNYTVDALAPTVTTNLPHATKPDMALTISEILKRYSSGRSVNVPVYDEYSGDDENLTGIDIRTLDMVEVQEMLSRVNESREKLILEQSRRRKLAADEKLEASIIAKYKARLEAEKPVESKPVYVQTSILDKPDLK